jgi:hypothetical protein
MTIAFSPRPTLCVCGQLWTVGHTCPTWGGITVYPPPPPPDPVCRRCANPRSRHMPGDSGLLCPVPRQTYEAP